MRSPTPYHPSSSSGVRLGDVVAGKYRVERLLGRGGMGMVVAARHVHLGERVAIKLLLPGSPVTSRAFARFVREGRAAARLRSEHVASVRDVGALSTGEPYLVLEYLHGLDLRTLSTKRGPFPVDTVVALVLQVCDAVAEAHSLGIVHRDLKPANLFLTRRADGSASVKVIDFGVSKITEDSDEQGSAASLTAHGAAVGTPGYMAPEQMRSARTVDARADIWSLGAVLYGLLTGASPFPGETMIEVYDRILKGTPSLRASRPDAPADLEEVVSRCLRVDVAGRYQDVGQLAEALRAVVPAPRRAAAERALGDEMPDPEAGDPPETSDALFPLVTTEPDPLGAELVRGGSEPDPTATPREASWADRRPAPERSTEAREGHRTSEPRGVSRTAAPGQRTGPRRPAMFAVALAIALAVSGAAIFGLRPSAQPPLAPSSIPPPPEAPIGSTPPANTPPARAPEPSAPPAVPPSAATAPAPPSSTSALPAPPATPRSAPLSPSRPAAARGPASAPTPSTTAAATPDPPRPARTLPGLADTPD